MKRPWKSFFAMLLVPVAVSAAGTALTPSSDLVPPTADIVQDHAGIALELSIWKPGQGIQVEEAKPTTAVRWLRPPRSALLWLPDDPAWSNGANQSLMPRRQLEW